MITGVFDTLPWAASFIGPAGYQLSTVEVRFAFGEHHHNHASYIADGQGFSRLVVLNGEARESGLPSSLPAWHAQEVIWHHDGYSGASKMPMERAYSADGTTNAAGTRAALWHKKRFQV